MPYRDVPARPLEVDEWGVFEDEGLRIWKCGSGTWIVENVDGGNPVELRESGPVVCPFTIFE